MLVAPVSNSLDLYVGIGAAYLAKLDVEILLPDSAFRSPLKAFFLRSIGCRPLLARSEKELAAKLIQSYPPKTPKLVAVAPQLSYLITPLGIFWYQAALEKHLPVAMVGIDHRSKMVKFHSWFYLSGVRARDIEFIYNFFAGITPSDPEKAIPRFSKRHSLLPEQ
jgi:hypothetical protein